MGSGFVPIVKEVNESDVPQPSGLRSQLHDGQNDININNITKVSNTMSSANPSLTRMLSLSPRSLFLSDDDKEGGYGCDRNRDSNERKNWTIESILFGEWGKKEKRRRVILAATTVATLSLRACVSFLIFSIL